VLDLEFFKEKQLVFRSSEAESPSSLWKHGCCFAFNPAIINDQNTLPAGGYLATCASESDLHAAPTLSWLQR